MEFNNAQKKAICHGDGPMMLLAGPGSGKTTVLTHRIKHMVQEQCIRPENILVITFTKAAAGEMKNRFQSLCPDVRGVTFGTFHSVFFWILRNAYNYTGADIATDAERCGAVRDSIERHGFRYDSQEDFSRNVLGEIGYVKSEMRDLSGYVSATMKTEDFQIVYNEYEHFLRSRGKIDFDDMLVFTYELFTQRDDIIDMWRNKFRYILIDEFQDINSIQYETIRMLAGKRKNIFVVGDDDQSIYGFRGAAPAIMKRFPEDFPGTVIEYLNVNYRCSYDVVECSKRVIKNNADRYDKNLQSEYIPGQSDRVHIVKVKDVAEQNRKIVDRIRELNNSGISYSDIAVIFRTNTEPRGLSSRLMENGIPFSMKDSIPNIFTHFLAENIFDYIRLARGSRDRQILFRVLNKPNRYISRDAIDSSQFDFEKMRQYYRDKYRIVNNINVLENDLERIGRLAPYAAVNYIRKAVGLDAYVQEYAEYRGVNADDYMDVLEEIQESARDFLSIDGWFEYVKEYTKELAKKNRSGVSVSDSVTLTTMHSAKGLEYSYVFIMDAVEGMTPHRKSVENGNVEEERRLFYVAVTRAKYGLYIYVPQKVFGKSVQASRFVQEMLVDRNLIKAGNKIIHKRYGKGVITFADDKKLCVFFEKTGETKTLSLEYTISNELIENA